MTHHTICINTVIKYLSLEHSHKKRKGSLDRALSAAELEFPKILVPRQPQNTSNVSYTKGAGKSKQLYSVCDQLFVALIYLHFIVLILMFLVDYASC